MLILQLDILCKYTNETPSSRNMIEGQNIINSGMLIMCGTTARTNNHIDLYALCLQTSALTSEPHVITGTLLIKYSNISNKGTIVIGKMNCFCKAGASHSGKHVVAVLLFCNR